MKHSLPYLLLSIILVLSACVSETPSDTVSRASDSVVSTEVDKNVPPKRSVKKNPNTINSSQSAPQHNAPKDDFLEVQSANNKSEVYSTKRSGFQSDGKSGKTTFNIEGKKIVFPELMRHVRLRGIDHLLEGTHKMMLPDISDSSELSATIIKVGPKIPTGTVGYNQTLEGTFTGDKEGTFRLSVYRAK